MSSYKMMPKWSPDGTKMLFYVIRPEWRGGLYLINADGTGGRQITDNPWVDEGADWSPDGRSVAFQSSRDGNFEIYVMGIDGSDPRNLTNNPHPDNWTSWGPVPATTGAGR